MKLRPKTAPNSPWYRPRSRGVKRSPITARAIGKSAPAPHPWMARKTISSPMLWESPERADPARKMTMPTISIRCLPKTSPSLP